MDKPTEAEQRQPHTTQDEQLLESPRSDEFTHTDTWRVFRIMGEFVEGFDELAYNHFIGRAFDNRIGGFMIAEVTRLINQNKKKLIAVKTLA